MSFRIAICDDDRVFREDLFTEVKDIVQELGINASISTFDSLKRFDSAVNLDEESFDLLILDIYMDDLNGYEYVKSRLESGEFMPMIFISATKDFILEGYYVDSLAYLVKPIDKNDLKQVILKAYNNLNKDRIVISSPSKVFSFIVDEILYIEVMERYIYVHLRDNQVERIKTLFKSILKLLSPDQFVKCHRSFIVSVPSITSINRKMITLSNKEEIPVSRKQYGEVQEA